MAESEGLDVSLRAALARAAEPGDPTGVADAIRARVAAGDPGTSARGPVAPGWARGILGGLLAGLLVVALAVGGGVGLAIGLAGPPGGAPVATGSASPSAPPTPGPDDGAEPTPTPTGSTTAAPTPLPPAPEPPAPAPPAPPPPDTTAPAVGATAAGQVWIANGSPATITATASDDRGVVAVTISWSGAATGSAAMTPTGATWTFVYDPDDIPTVPGQLDFVVTAVDAAGNAGTALVSVPAGM